MGLVGVPQPQAAGTQSLFARLRRGFGSTNPRDDVTSTLRSENSQLQQQLTRASEQLTQSRSDNQELRREMAEEITEKGQENTRLQQQLAHANEQLTLSNNQRQRSDTENQQQIATLRGQVDVLQQRVSSTNRTSHPQEVEFWQVSPEEVSIREDEILGRGPGATLPRKPLEEQRWPSNEFILKSYGKRQLIEFVVRFVPWLTSATPTLSSLLLPSSTSKQVP